MIGTGLSATPIAFGNSSPMAWVSMSHSSSVGQVVERGGDSIVDADVEVHRSSSRSPDA